MSNVISLFGNGAPVATPVQETAPEAPDVRQESQTAVEPKAPVPPKAPVYVRVQAELFQDMMNALSFYALPGWDEGKKARAVMGEIMKPEPPAA